MCSTGRLATLFGEGLRVGYAERRGRLRAGSRGETEEAGAMSWRGKLSQVLKELCIHCQYSPASMGTRYIIPRRIASLPFTATNLDSQLCSRGDGVHMMQSVWMLQWLRLWNAATLPLRGSS
jgi:hypothetical protein